MKSSSSSAGVDETNDIDSLEENHIKQCLLRDVCCVSIYLTALETEEEGVGGEGVCSTTTRMENVNICEGEIANKIMEVFLTAIVYWSIRIY